MKNLITAMFLIANLTLYAQNEVESRITPFEFSIPSSPVFDLMGVTPAQVTKTSDIKDFKVDWSFKSWSLSPNISLQSQPIWEILYNRRDIKKYQKATKLMRTLASIDISAGTVRDENTDRRIGLAAKVNLYKEKDALLENAIYEDIEKEITKDKIEISQAIIEAKFQLDTTKNILYKPAARQKIQSLEFELLTLNSKRKNMINERATVVALEHWNGSWIDFGIGKVNAYITNESGNLSSLRLNRSSARGVWINAGVGIGKNVLLSGLIRTNLYDEQVNFTIKDEITGSKDTASIGSNTLKTFGINLRYGNPYFTFFSEFIYERRSLKTPLEAIKKVFITPDNFEIIGSSVNWTVVHPYKFNFGGDWRMNKNLALNFSMQTIWDSKLKLRTFLPVVGLACMMR